MPAAGVKALRAEEESETSSWRQKGKKRSTVEAAFWHGGQRSFGWVEGTRLTDELGRTGARLVPHPVEHPALKWGVELAVGGTSTAKIAEAWAKEFGPVTTDGANMHQGVGAGVPPGRLGCAATACGRCRGTSAGTASRT